VIRDIDGLIAKGTKSVEKVSSLNENCLIIDLEIIQVFFQKNWIYLAKFCFISLESRIQFKVSYPTSYQFQLMTIYYDDQWQKVYPKKDMSCQSKQDQASISQKIELNPASSYFGIK
jgi:hypothetical protein